MLEVTYADTFLYRINRAHLPCCEVGYTWENIEHLSSICPSYESQRSVLNTAVNRLAAHPVNIEQLLGPWVYFADISSLACTERNRVGFGVPHAWHSHRLFIRSQPTVVCVLRTALLFETGTAGDGALPLRCPRYMDTLQTSVCNEKPSSRLTARMSFSGV